MNEILCPWNYNYDITVLVMSGLSIYTVLALSLIKCMWRIMSWLFMNFKSGIIYYKYSSD